jgi:hypothetical protein
VSSQKEDQDDHSDQDPSDPFFLKEKAVTTKTGAPEESTFIPHDGTTTTTLPTTTCTNNTEPLETQSRRYLEMLVHNVSHTDLVLSVNAPPQQNESPYCLCAPRFSAFDMYCRRILASLSGDEIVVNFPRYERSETSPRYSIVTPKPSRQGLLQLLPTGLELAGLERHCSNLVLLEDELPNLRFRGRDAHRIEPYYTNQEHVKRLQISHAFFPLLATLLPQWQSEMKQKFAHFHNVKKVIVLVSGVGTPRNWTHSITGNSTQACAELMERFIHVLYPDVTVVRYVLVLVSYFVMIICIYYIALIYHSLAASFILSTYSLVFTRTLIFFVMTKTFALSRENSCLASMPIAMLMHVVNHIRMNMLLLPRLVQDLFRRNGSNPFQSRLAFPMVLMLEHTPFKPPCGAIDHAIFTFGN